MENYLLTNSSKLFYTDIGLGEPILFLHGGPGLSHEYMQPLMNEMESLGYRIISFDQRGNGLSNEFSLETISIDNLVEDIESIRQELSIDKKIIIFAHSFGTHLAIKYVQKYADNVSKMILCSSAPTSFEYFQRMNMTMSKQMDMDKEKFEAVNEAMIKGDEDVIIDYMMSSITHQFKNPFIGKSFIDKFKSNQLDIKKFALISQLLMNEYFQNLQSMNYGCNIETLFLHGDSDAIPVESTKNLVACFANSKLVIIKDSGHYPFIEKQSLVASMIDEFLQ